MRPVIHNLTGGHPFYITAVCRRIMNLVDVANRPMNVDTAKQAFITETLAPHGRIYDFCRYVYDLSLQKATGYGALKAVLQILATDEGLTISQTARRLRVTAAAASDYLRWLREVDLVIERNRQYYFRDPVLRFWVANTVRGVEVSLTAEPLDLAGLVAGLDAQFQRASEELGEAQESAVRELMRRFDGRTVNAEIFGFGGELVLPRFVKVETYRSSDGQVQLDAVGETPDGKRWVVEVKWRNKRVGRKEVEKLARLAEDFGARAWLVSGAGFTGQAVEYANQMGIYLTDVHELQRLRRLLT